VLSFGYLFFAQAKKSNSLATASETKGRTIKIFVCPCAEAFRVDHKAGPSPAARDDSNALNIRNLMIL
jgi:hypothetical protein